MESLKKQERIIMQTPKGIKIVINKHSSPRNIKMVTNYLEKTKKGL